MNKKLNAVIKKKGKKLLKGENVTLQNFIGKIDVETDKSIKRNNKMCMNFLYFCTLNGWQTAKYLSSDKVNKFIEENNNENVRIEPKKLQYKIFDELS